MTKYRIVSKGGKFYIQEKKAATWWRRNPKWKYVKAGILGGGKWCSGSLSKAKTVMAMWIEDDRRATEPFHVVEESE